MKKEIIFLTGNQDKIHSAQKVFADYTDTICLKTKKIKIPEIQSMEVQEVAENSVYTACKKLNRPVFKVDCGYYFVGLHGFPGALVKYFDKSISSNDLLRLLEGKSKKVVVRECLSYCEPGKNPVSFVEEIIAQIADRPQGKGGTIDKLIIYKGFNKPQAACEYNSVIEYWNKNLHHYEKLVHYLSR